MRDQVPRYLEPLTLEIDKRLVLWDYSTEAGLGQSMPVTCTRC